MEAFIFIPHPRGIYITPTGQRVIALAVGDADTNAQEYLAENAEDAALLAGLRVAPKNVPQVLTAVQLRLWLLRNKLSVDAAIDGLPEEAREDARIRWEYSTEVRRDNPLVGAIGHILKLPPTDLDQAFREASKL